MNLIVGFILYWFSTNGYLMLFVSRFQVKKEFSFAVFASLLIIVLFLSSILNMLLLFSMLILLGGFFSYLYLNKKGLLTKEFLKSFFDYKYFLFLIFILYFTLVGQKLHLIHYDNFSHWALSIKQLFINNTLGSFKYNVDSFTSYPPGSALFTYYFGLMFGKSESAMIIGHSYLNFFFMMPIMALFSEKKKLKSSIVFIILVLLFTTINIQLNELLVDTTLGLIGITSFIYTFVSKDHYKKCFYGLTLFSILFVLIKNSGIIFALLNAILFYIVLRHNNKVKEGKKYLIIMFLVVGAILLIWNKHLSMVYPSDDGYTSKHSLSIHNVGRNVLGKGPSKILEITKIYLNKMFSIKNNVINHYLIIINVFILFMTFVYRSRKKFILKSLLFLDILALLYYIALGTMYIVSMPYQEALYLACFNRYMLTLIVTLMGILLIIFYNNIENTNRLNNLIYVLLIGFFGIIIFNKDYKMLVGKDNYNDSNIKEVNLIKDTVNLDEYKYHEKVFHLENKGTCSFYEFALKYAYFDEKIKVSCQGIDVNNLPGETIIVLEKKDKKWDQEEKLLKINDYVYQVLN